MTKTYVNPRNIFLKIYYFPSFFFTISITLYIQCFPQLNFTLHLAVIFVLGKQCQLFTHYENIIYEDNKIEFEPPLFL